MCRNIHTRATSFRFEGRPRNDFFGQEAALHDEPAGDVPMEWSDVILALDRSRPKGEGRERLFETDPSTPVSLA